VQVMPATMHHYYLIRVVAPKGLKILDTPQFQVNRLIRASGKFSQPQQQPHSQNHTYDTTRSRNSSAVSSSHLVSQMESMHTKSLPHHSIFQTMSGRLTSTGPSLSGNPAVFDVTSKSRILPRGVLFEASTRMETTDAYYNQGAGLIKLSDNSGWAIVPRQSELEHQYRNFTLNGLPTTMPDGTTLCAYKEVGSAILDTHTSHNNEFSSTIASPKRTTIWLRVLARAGVLVSCLPPAAQRQNWENDNTTATSPSSSRESSAIASSNPNAGGSHTIFTSNDSDVASSVGSAFLDALFRTPQKKKAVESKEPTLVKGINSESQIQLNNVIACGMFLEVERYVNAATSVNSKREYARLVGGQGWIPLVVADKPTAASLSCPPEFRYGSFWFRVQSSRGLKVRLGPSIRASSIKSEDGAYFRFECGEFLRASETVTAFSESGDPIESFAKLYRNRHIRLHSGHHDDFRSLSSLTIQAEWVQVHNDAELFLEECSAEPRIERHKQGWRYNIVPENGIAIRKGPSFAAEKTGLLLFGGESIVINERVTPAGDTMSWLRLKDGQGWIHDFDETGQQIVIAHSLRHRVMSSRSRKPQSDEIAYNAIISRLFNNDDNHRPAQN
jgi:hypothetical protein